MKEKHSLVFTITEHEFLGPLIEPFVVEHTKNDEFSLKVRKVNTLTVHDYPFQVSDAESEIIKLAGEYADEAIVEKFTKSKVKPVSYFNELTDEKYKKLIRPYIERRLLKCVRLIVDHKIPLYFKGKKRDNINNQPLEVYPVPADVVFNFVRSDEETRYFLTIKNHEGEMSLTGKTSKILCLSPTWVLIDQGLYTFDSRIDGNKLMPFFTKEYISIPLRSELKYYQTFILNAIKSFDVNAKGFGIVDEIPSVIPILKIERNLQGSAILNLYFQYDDKTFLSTDKESTKVSFHQDDHHYFFRKFSRDVGKEERIISFLESIGLKKSSHGGFYPDKQPGLPEQQANESQHDTSAYLIVNWLNDHQIQLSENQIRVEQGQTEKRYFTGEIDLDITIAEKNDWFDIYALIHFGDFKIPFVKLKHQIINHIREYILPDGSIAVLPAEWFVKYQELVVFGKGNDELVQLKKHHFPIAKNVASELKNPLKITDPTEIFNNGNNINTRLPATLNARLRPYQVDGFRWMKALHHCMLGGCLADDMGLGKTLQTLTLLLHTKKSKQTGVQLPTRPDKPVQLNLFHTEDTVTTSPERTSLLVMPASLIHNWENEIEKFTPTLHFFSHTGLNRLKHREEFHKYDLILTTYGIIRNDLELLKDIDFWYIILDESQLIKNPSSKLYRAVKQLKSTHKLVLTGTPVENSLTDLWAQLSFLNDGMLGNLNYFKKEFVVPIEKERNADKEEKLNTLIKPFILRRTKESVAKELPLLTEKIYYVEMTDEQKKIYDEKKAEIRNYILKGMTSQGVDKSRFIILKGLMQLRLLSNHPLLAYPEYGHGSGKFEEVIRNVDSLLAENHKVLIYSQFVKHLTLFKNYFNENQYKYAYLTGQVKPSERKQVISNFQGNENVKLFLISLKAGGVGLNLTSADYVFILDPWWNPAVENQALSRAHRIGQEKKVFSYKFITRNSIEEKILNLQSKKSDLAGLFINNNNPLQFFTQGAIEQLIE